MPLTIPTLDESPLSGFAGRSAGPHSDPQPGMDQLQSERSGRDAAASLRVSHGELALSQQSDSRAQPAQVPVAAGCAVATGFVGARLVTFNNETRCAANSDAEQQPRSARRASALSHHGRARRAAIEAQVFYKRELTDVPQQCAIITRSSTPRFAARPPSDPTQLRMYDTRPLVTRSTGGLDVGKDTMDSSLWIALLVRAGDKPYDQTIDDAREAIGGKTLNLGLVPYFDVPQRTLTPGTAPAENQNLLKYPTTQDTNQRRLVHHAERSACRNIKRW